MTLVLQIAAGILIAAVVIGVWRGRDALAATVHKHVVGGLVPLMAILGIAAIVVYVVLSLRGGV